MQKKFENVLCVNSLNLFTTDGFFNDLSQMSSGTSLSSYADGPDNLEDQFKTIRPTSIVTRQAKEHESELREQFTGKKMLESSHVHHCAVIQLHIIQTSIKP